MAMDKISKALTELYRARGEVTATSVLESAKRKNSPLHGCFEWDDQKAGHEYRLIQARKLIRAYPVEVAGKKERLVHVPAVESAGRAEGKYVTLADLKDDDVEYERAYAAANNDLQSALRRVNELRRLAKNDEKGKWASIAEMIETTRLALVS